MSQETPATLRPLRPQDLDGVVEIDRQASSRSRRVFFEKRLEAALANSAGFITIAAEIDGVLFGFAIARLQNGEFGEDSRIAILDVIGVERSGQHAGLGHQLLDGITGSMKKLNIAELRTQVDWSDRKIFQFFSAAGFSLAPQQVLERATARNSLPGQIQGNTEMATAPDPDITMQRMDAGVPDYSDPGGDDFAALSRDRVLVRSMTGEDLEAIIRIDEKLIGRNRAAYHEAKFREVVNETGIRVSVVAEVDGRPAGYIMARLDYGEFGHTEPVAVIDTIGVDPGLGHSGIGSAILSQLLFNLDALHVERVRTSVSWNNFALLGFLERNHFKPAQHLVLTKTVEPQVPTNIRSGTKANRV